MIGGDDAQQIAVVALLEEAGVLAIRASMLAHGTLVARLERGSLPRAVDVDVVDVGELGLPRRAIPEVIEIDAFTVCANIRSGSHAARGLPTLCMKLSRTGRTRGGTDSSSEGRGSSRRRPSHSRRVEASDPRADPSRRR
jgi:hypothetical protein